MDDLAFEMKKVFAATIVNAQYAAYTFYQNTKGAPLTPQEMTDINEGVLRDVGYAVKQVVAM